MWGYYNFTAVANVDGNGISLNRQTKTNTSGGLQQYRQSLKTAQTEIANGMAKPKATYIKNPVNNMGGAPVSKTTGTGLPTSQAQVPTTPSVATDGTVTKVKKEPAWVAYTNTHGNAFGGSGGAFGRR